MLKLKCKYNNISVNASGDNIAKLGVLVMESI